ncbi:MAG TPA: alpha/beta family hydrolase [Candidatus Sulfopaludibacter sp.]|jgi:hypothetical protein|nr:alpha/beta family hydrolase [Candidatus Sulfopaludibacter sp.]
MEELFDQNGIGGILHRPDVSRGEAIALTHGAGSNHTAPLLVKMSQALADAGYLTLRYDLPFRRQRPKGSPFPAGAARDREGVVAAVAALRGMVTGRVFAGGHSYGGRQTAMAAAENPGMADGLLLFSYPLHPPNQPGKMRTAFFPDLRTPALFVHGTSDPFATPEELREALALIPARTELMLVEGGGHDLKRAPGLSAEILERFHALVGFTT